MQNRISHRLWTISIGLSLGAALACPALAQTATIRDGVYDAFNCAAEESDQRIEIAGDTVTFYGYACTLSDPGTIAGVDGAMLFSATCEGEGDTWNEGLILLQTRDGGLAALTANWGDHYERCD